MRGAKQVQKGKVQVGCNERYVGIAQSSRRGKTRSVQESEARIYTIVKPEGARAHESNGTS